MQTVNIVVFNISLVGRGRDLIIEETLRHKSHKRSLLNRPYGRFPFHQKLHFDFAGNFPLNFPIQNWTPRYTGTQVYRKLKLYIHQEKNLTGRVLFRREKPYRRSIYCCKISPQWWKKKLSVNSFTERAKKEERFNSSRDRHLRVFLATYYQRS